MRSLIPLVIQNSSGNAVANANVAVSMRSGGPATVFSAETGDAQISNPVTSDANGRVAGWLEPGSYSVLVNGSNITTYTRTFEVVRGEAISNIAPDVVTSDDFASGAITAAKLTNASVLGAKLADGAVATANIADDAVSARTLTENSIDGASFATDAVTTAKLVDGAALASKLANSSVNTTGLSDASVGTSDIAASSVGTNEIGDAGLPGSKFAPKAINGSHIAAATITSAKFNKEVYPPGCILPAAVSATPSGWALLDGTAISRAANPVLFALIGTTFGVGDGSTTFNLPDARGRHMVGRMPGGHPNVSAVGDSDGAAVGNRKPQHYHGVGSFYFGDGNHIHASLTGHDGGITGLAQYGTYFSRPIWQRYHGNVLGGTFDSAFGDSYHSHGVANWVGVPSSPQNAPAYLAVNYFIKLG